MSLGPEHCTVPGIQEGLGQHLLNRSMDGAITPLPPLFSASISLGTWGHLGGKSLRQRGGAWQGRQRGMVPEPRMVGRALGGRDPVRELVLLLPLLLVPPPLHVSCREESWPGIEMDLAVDGGLGKTEGCDWGVPPSESEENKGAPPLRKLAPTLTS